MSNRSNAQPLLEALLSYERKKAARFHVPGHKARTQAYAGEAESYYRAVLKLDGTEISGLDDLHHPEGAILEAQRLAALCFGAEETFFLVGGSTVGNQALIVATCRPGDLLLVQRNAHKSVINGLMLAGARAVFLTPRQRQAHRLPAGGLAFDDIKEALRKYPEAKGLLVTNPNYYGLGVDLKPIAELLHRHNKVLLVDEAHGAHYGFHPELPPSAMASGADAAVQSTHKMLTAMTMGSMLHVRGNRINRPVLRKALSMLQSSSPSYPIMASLDLSRSWVQEHGFEKIEEGLKILADCKKQLEQMERWNWVHANDQDNSENLDPFKLTIYDSSRNLSGFELQERLEQQNCYAEMADPEHVLLAFSPANTAQDVSQLLNALQIIDHETPANLDPTPNLDQTLHIQGMSLISEPVAFRLETIHQDAGIQHLPIKSCIGKTAAELIVPYPPGIPLLFPGERISESTAAELIRLVKAGARFQGYNVTALETLPVYTG